MKKLSSLLTVILLSQTALKAQQIITSKDYPQTYFRSPLDIKAEASGTFGELRSTHFHGGSDYRTQQRIGLPLYAAAEGYVYRVRAQIGGGGNAIYIAHPNGYSTVYLHMDRFNDQIQQLVKAEQYRLKKFEVDLELPAQQVLVSKGQLIGKTGNTGGSGGPHLHFEVRDSKTQNPLNSQLFGLQFADNIPPTIHGITVYDLNEPMFNEFTPRRQQSVSASTAGNYKLTSAAVIPVNGKFSFGINSNDRHNGTTFSNGVYSIELFLDGEAISTVVFEELDFASTRAIHSYIDYPYQMRSKAKVQKSFKDPGNPIPIFKHLKNRGIIELQDNEVHELKYVVKDVKGNCSELNFQVQNRADYQPAYQRVEPSQYFAYNQENSFNTERVKLQLAKGVLYDNLNFIYKETAKPANGYSPVQHIHNNLTPVFDAYQLSIKADASLPESLYSKALLVSTQGGAQGGTYENGWVKASMRIFGSFYIAVDTIAPKITARNFSPGKHVASQSSIDFTISDNLSGIQSFHGYIDGKWVLFEYDSKNRHIWHTFDGLEKGAHELRIEVIDWKNNKAVYTANFTR